VRFAVHRDEGDAVFTVRDRGIGIPAEDLKRIFTAFHRGNNVGQLPGSGLGLVIVKRCVDLHHGRIKIDSVEGEGTTVEVRLPLFVKTGHTATVRKTAIVAANLS
jgi:signal transduction histidine kinase